VLNQYLIIAQKDWGEHLGLVEFCYNSITHSVTKMSLFELMLGRKTKKIMDLAIPMGHKDHSKEVMEMFKGHKEKYA